MPEPLCGEGRNHFPVVDIFEPPGDIGIGKDLPDRFAGIALPPDPGVRKHRMAEIEDMQLQLFVRSEVVDHQHAFVLARRLQPWLFLDRP
ncbi:hypothetical protein D3C87_1639030 [compost metagenome]